MSNNPLATIAVTGAGGPAGVAVIRRLTAAGYQVLALDADPTAVGLRLASRHAVIPRADDAYYAAALIKIAAAEGATALISTVAEELTALTLAAPDLAEAGIATWLPSVEAAERCNDKLAFAAALHAAGVAHPDTAATFADTVANVPGPWVIKPARGRGSRDVVLADTLADLDAAFQTVPHAMAQTRIEGQEFTADTLVDRDGSVAVVVPRWREETKAGISTKGSTFTHATVTDTVKAAVAAVGLTGPACVQGFLSPDGSVTIIEINPRFSGGLPLTLASGADVVTAYLGGILNPGRPLPAIGYAAGVRMLRYFSEVFETVADAEPVPDPLRAQPAS